VNQYALFSLCPRPCTTRVEDILAENALGFRIVVPAALKAEVRATMDLVLALGLEPMHLTAWQAFWVGLFCRMLHTLATGAVHSKKAGYAWALENLDPRWAPLIAEAATLRKGDDTQAAQPADPSLVAETHAFATYARAYADEVAKD